MRATKRKLMAAASMLMISTLMMTSATFAWLTISTAPEISGIGTTFATNGNLEIALRTSDNNADGPKTLLDDNGSAPTNTHERNITWGNLVDLSDNDATAKDVLNTVHLKPVTYVDNNGFEYPEYGLDGRMTSLTLMTTPDVNESVDSGIGVMGPTEGSTTAPYLYYVDFFLRTNKAGNINLTQEGVQRAVSADATSVITNAPGSGSTFTDESGVLTKGIVSNLRVRFEINDVDAALTLKPDITIGTDGTDADPVGSGAIKLVYASGSSSDMTLINDAEANKAYKVRMYVYLDGQGLTNASYAPLLATGADAESIKGTLNIQFTHSDTELKSFQGVTLKDSSSGS